MNDAVMICHALVVPAKKALSKQIDSESKPFVKTI